jgi:hypothetical protein
MRQSYHHHRFDAPRQLPCGSASLQSSAILAVAFVPIVCVITTTTTTTTTKKMMAVSQARDRLAGSRLRG